jgi:hypothetical protein
MNTLTHANSFATPTLNKCNFSLSLHLLRSADQSLGYKTHSVDKNRLCSCLYDCRSVTKFTLNKSSRGSVYGRSGGGFRCYTTAWEGLSSERYTHPVASSQVAIQVPRSCISSKIVFEVEDISRHVCKEEEEDIAQELFLGSDSRGPTSIPWHWPRPDTARWHTVDWQDTRPRSALVRERGAAQVPCVYSVRNKMQCAVL